MLRVEIGQVRDQVLDHRLMRQWRDGDDFGRHLIPAARAGNCIVSANIHCAGPANALTARATEGQRRIDLILDVDQDIQDHRATIGNVHEEAVPAGLFSVFRTVAIDAELAQIFLSRTLWLWPNLTFSNLGILRERELNHSYVLSLVNPNLGLNIFDLVRHRVVVNRAVIDFHLVTFG